MNRVAAAGFAAILALLYLPPWSGMLGMFPAHMVRHMGLVAIAAPLLVLALPSTARRFSPPVAFGAFLEFAVVWAWHLPGLHRAARAGEVTMLLEQGTFLAAGWAVWAGALTAREPMAGAGSLFLTSIHMTMLGALLILAPADLYGGGDQLGAPLQQQLGGMLMLAIGTPVYILGGLVLMRRTLRAGNP